MKILNQKIYRNEEGFFKVDSELDHEDLDIILDALNDKLHKGIPDLHVLERAKKVYAEIFAMWEATGEDTNNQKPLPNEMVRINDTDPRLIRAKLIRDGIKIQVEAELKPKIEAEILDKLEKEGKLK